MFVNNTPVRFEIRPLILTIHLKKENKYRINKYELKLKQTERYNNTKRQQKIEGKGEITYKICTALRN